MKSPSTSTLLGTFGSKIHFDGFEISWAGVNPLTGKLCFGSDDGRFRNLETPGPTDPATPSGEAINGIAISGRAMAASTRSDVGLIVFDQDGSSRRTVYAGGAHDVIAISSGGFVAPLGRNGILTMKPTFGQEQIVTTMRMNGDRVNFYKLAHCGGDGRTDLIVGASRGDGLVILELDSLEDRVEPRPMDFLQTPGMDVIDVCSLESPEWPHAIAMLGIDRSIHFSRNVLNDTPFKSLQIRNLRGKAYSIRQSHGHLFLLTDAAIYVFTNLVSRFMSDNSVSVHVPAFTHYTKDVDEISVAGNAFLLHVNGDVLCFPMESFATKSDQNYWSSDSGYDPEIVESYWEKTNRADFSSEPSRVA